MATQYWVLSYRYILPQPAHDAPFLTKDAAQNYMLGLIGTGIYAVMEVGTPDTAARTVNPPRSQSNIVDLIRLASGG